MTSQFREIDCSAIQNLSTVRKHLIPFCSMCIFGQKWQR